MLNCPALAHARKNHTHTYPHIRAHLCVCGDCVNTRTCAANCVCVFFPLWLCCCSVVSRGVFAKRTRTDVTCCDVTFIRLAIRYDCRSADSLLHVNLISVPSGRAVNMEISGALVALWLFQWFVWRTKSVWTGWTWVRVRSEWKFSLNRYGECITGIFWEVSQNVWEKEKA